MVVVDEMEVDHDAVNQQAALALSQATVAPDQARVLALAARTVALSTHSWSAASVASRALGLSCLQLRDLNGSMIALRASVKYAERAGARHLVGEARMSMAATLCVRGLAARAVKEIELALDDLDGVAAARGTVQRAAVLQDLGRYDESLADIRKALPLLRRAGDVEWETRALSNRGILLISRRSFTAAQDDLTAAGRLCAEHGLGLQGAYVEHNLGWLNSSRREVPMALEHFDLANRAFDRLGMKVGSLFADRGELLLSVRLLEEAREAAETAVSIHRKQRRHLQVPEAQLLLSTVALVQGDAAQAIACADQAIRGYRRLHRGDGLALARFARLQAKVASDPSTVTPARARRCADDLAAAGWMVPALEARMTAGILALGRGRSSEARLDLAAAGRARFSGPADARARAWYAEALMRRADGHRRSAKSAISAGLRVVENYQATLGATELRAHVSIHRGSLAALGLRLALEDGDPGKVLSFVERGRASALLQRSARPPSDPTLSRDLADLRTTMGEIEDQRRVGRSTAELTKRQVTLERAIADYSRRTAAVDGHRMAARSVGELSRRLKESALIEYVALDEDLYAVTLVDGRTRLHSLGGTDRVQRDLPHLAFALRRLANPRTSEAGVLGALAMINRIRESLGHILMDPLATEIGDRALVVVPVDPLQSFPWSVLPSCAGRPVTISPSATLWYDAAGRPVPTGPARFAAVAGPHLPGAREEVEAFRGVHPDATILLDDGASVAAVSKVMDGAALVHVAAHGRLRSDNPQFSSLLMSDGPLTVYDLERLGQAPHHVVLAACGAARPHVVATDEVLGLAAALLRQGTSSLVAPVISVLDEVTVELMGTYHAELRAGGSPAGALAIAQEKAAAKDPLSWATAVPFVCMGAGHEAGVFSVSSESLPVTYESELSSV